MSDNLVIVGLPQKNHVVNDVSSEKAAHVTLLFLGDNADLSEEIVEYVQHAVETSFEPIYLETRERGPLGPDQADVLFFEGHGARQLAEFRSLLLKNPHIRNLYDAQEQYPQFTPHLTLGYPGKPAKEPENEWSLEAIQIDRIAVWNEDSDGPEFKPQYKDHSEASIGAWSDEPDLIGLGYDVLSHYGVKGMKWGVINEDDPKGRDGGGEKPTRADKRAAKDAELQRKIQEYDKIADSLRDNSGLDSNNLKAKYGPPDKAAAQAKKDYSEYKSLAIKAGIGIGLAGLAYGAYKYAPEGTPVIEFMRNAGKVGDLTRTNQAAYANARDGLAVNWSKGVDIPAGGVLKRLGSVAEKEARPDGFFACYRDQDVESYKAILPTFWRGWGVGDPVKGGFLNHYQAKVPIKAPSGEESLKMFKDLIHSDDKFNSMFANPVTGHNPRKYSDAEMKELFLGASSFWVDASSPMAKPYLDKVKGQGFNALIDFNDAGKLGKTPLRVLDGSLFDIVKNEPMGLDDFHKAAKAWKPELIHMFNRLGGAQMGEIWHYGVKGMKWGVRKAGSSGAVSVRRDGSGNRTVGVGKDKGPQEVKTTAVRIGPKTEVRTSKGGYQKAHPDAIAAKSAAQRKKKSGVDTLSNKELEALANRMNLEQRIRDLEERRPDSQLDAGRKYVQREVAKKGLTLVPGGSAAAKVLRILNAVSQEKKVKKGKNNNN